MSLRTIFHPHSDGTFTIQRYDDDIEPTLDANKAAQNMPAPRADGLRHIASIPAVIYEKWLNEAGFQPDAPQHEINAFIRRKIADPDNRWMRTVGKL